MASVLFFMAALGAIAGAIGVVSLRDPFYAVLALVVHLLSLALLFLLLRSEFVAAVQVVVYAGAVMVLYVFVVAYVGDESESLGARLRAAGPSLTRHRGAGGEGVSRLGAALVGGALLVELLIALLGTGLKAIAGDGAPYAPGPRTFGTPAYIGNLLLTRFLLVFEAASFLLLVAAVGAVVLARRRGGLGEDEGRELLTPMDLLRPRGTGTMAEGVAGLPFAARRARESSGTSAASGTASSADAGDSTTDADERASAAERVAATSASARTGGRHGEGGW